MQQHQQPDEPDVEVANERCKMTPGVTKSGKSALYMTGLFIACIAGYMYGTVNNGSYIAVNSWKDNLLYTGDSRNTVPDVSRTIQSSLPFGVCEGGDCSAIPAEDIKIVAKEEDAPVEEKDNQNTRKATIKRVCRENEQLVLSKISDVTLKTLYVDEKDKIIYCSIPKAGCTSWKRLLMSATNDSVQVESISKDYAHHNKMLRTLYEYPESQREPILRSYRKFTFVRNPFIRLLSAYKDKFESLWQYRDNPNGIYFRRFAADIMHKYRPNATEEELRSGENVTWPEFVLYVSHLRESDFNEHWTPMYRLCAPCQIRYDFVGRIENIGNDYRYLQKKLLNFTHAPTRFPGQYDRPTNSSEYTYDAYGEVTLQQLRQLWDIYKWDFWLFGYKKPDFI
ncbi:carbohydrate sulfotransferase 11-like [Diadema setosum]|uniref:carbohydrate sulfotransferase 11-like n=1 Tax=Diadema setosum TaxID=31175 RepID=UPI003B3A1DFF